MATNSTLPKGFSEWTVTHAGQAVPTAANAETNRLFYAGDHWQNGKGWPTPRPITTDTGTLSSFLANVKRGFISKNVINEVVDRHLLAVIGREPSRSATVRRPLGEGDELESDEQELITEAESLLDSWWNSQHGITSDDNGVNLVSLHKAVREAVKEQLLTGRSGFRIRVPVGDDDETETGEIVLPSGNIEDVITRLYAQVAHAEQIGVYTNPNTLESAAVFAYKGENGRDMAEMSYLDGEDTALRIIGGGESALPINGRLTIRHMQGRSLINDSVRQNQIALNKALTTGGENLSYAYPTTDYVNLMPPGDDGTADGSSTGKLATGAGVANFLYGAPIYDPETNEIKGYAPGSVFHKDPTPPDTYEKSKDMFYRAILEEVDQLHALMSGDATASGVSRVQAKDDFRKSLLATKEEIESALEWLFETVLAMAAVFSGDVGRFDGLRINVECRIDTGVVTPEERKQNNDDYEAGTLSRESAIRANGTVDDAPAEIQRIDREENNSLNGRKMKAEIAAELGVNTSAAYEVAGFNSDDAAKLAARDRILPSDRRAAQNPTPPLPTSA